MINDEADIVKTVEDCIVQYLGHFHNTASLEILF